MNTSIVKALVKKDFDIMRLPIIYWWLGGLLAIAVVIFGGSGLFLFGFILFVTAMAGAGVHAVMQTVVEERREQTLAFIMSLPLTIREYTAAKLIVNVSMFGVVWLTLSVASMVIFLGDSGMQEGARPFVTIVLVGIFLAYAIILAVSMVTESIGWAIFSMVAANIGTQIFLHWASDLYGIRSVIKGDVAMWNSTELTILGGQILMIVGLIAMIFLLQTRKRDFI